MVRVRQRFQPTLGQKKDPAGHATELVAVVGHPENRALRLTLVANGFLLHQVSTFWIEICRGLVKEKHARLAVQNPCESEALTFAGGEPFDWRSEDSFGLKSDPEQPI